MVEYLKREETGMGDANGNGVPDYLERTITTTRENEDGSKTVDRMKLEPPARKMMGQAQEGLEAAKGGLAAPQISARDRFRAESLYGADRSGSMSDRRMQSASAVDRLMGLGAGDRQRAAAGLGQEFLKMTAPAALKGEADVAANEATARGMRDQGLGAATLAAGEKRYQTQTEAQTAAADLAQRVKEYNARSEVKPLTVGGQQVGLIVNGQLLDLREKPQEGFYQLKDANGRVTGAMTRDGVVMRQNDRGELVVDRPSQVIADPVTGAAIGLAGGARPLPANPFAANAAAGPAADTVRIQAPDGTVQAVPRAKAEYYVSKGGKIVG